MIFVLVKPAASRLVRSVFRYVAAYEQVEVGRGEGVGEKVAWGVQVEVGHVVVPSQVKLKDCERQNDCITPSCKTVRNKKRMKTKC